MEKAQPATAEARRMPAAEPLTPPLTAPVRVDVRRAAQRIPGPPDGAPRRLGVALPGGGGAPWLSDMRAPPGAVDACAPIQRQLRLDLGDGLQSIAQFGQTFRREIAAALLRHNHTPTQPAWTELERMVASPTTEDFTLAELLAYLIDHGLTRHIDEPATSSHNPHVAGHQPKWAGRFSPATLAAIQAKGTVTHRRHVIGRHTLGTACARAQDPDSDVLAFIGGRNKRTGNAAFTQRYQGRALNADQRREIRTEAYRILQDHPGNIHPGDAGHNVAMGFLTGLLFDWFDALADGQITTVEAAIKALEGITTFAFAQSAMDEKTQMIGARIEHLWLNLHGTRNKPILVDQPTVITNEHLVAIGEFVRDVGVDCEFDKPEGQPEYSAKAKELFEAFRTRDHLFGADGPAEVFMDQQPPSGG